MKKFGIIGPGAVGTTIAHSLIQSNLDVTLFGRTQSDVYYQEYGHADKQTIPVTSLQSSSKKIDILFIAVKTTQLDDIIPYIPNITHQKSVIILTQNGYGQLKKIIHPHKYQAVVYISGQKKEQTVTHFRDWTLKLPTDDQTIALQQLTKHSPLNIECINNYPEEIWYKLLVNLGINTVTAITQKTASVLKKEGIYELCYNLLSEGVQIANAEGAFFKEDLIESIMHIYDGYPDDMGTSMYYDIINNQKLEIDYIQGHFYHLSEKHKLNTPHINSTYFILKAIENG